MTTPTLKGSKTEANLWAAFAGESQARNKYTYYASKARKDGYVQIAKIFDSNFEEELQKIYLDARYNPPFRRYQQKGIDQPLEKKSTE